MATFLEFPRGSPLIVEGYADGTTRDEAYITSRTRATAVRDYLQARFSRQATLTGIMPLGRAAEGSPSGDGTWDGVALALFVDRGGRR